MTPQFLAKIIHSAVFITKFLNPFFLLRVFNRHQELHKKVTAAEVGTVPMEDLALNQLKKEKLWAKDQLARMMDTVVS